MQSGVAEATVTGRPEEAVAVIVAFERYPRFTGTFLVKVTPLSVRTIESIVFATAGVVLAAKVIGKKKSSDVSAPAERSYRKKTPHSSMEQSIDLVAVEY